MEGMNSYSKVERIFSCILMYPDLRIRNTPLQYLDFGKGLFLICREHFAGLRPIKPGAAEKIKALARERVVARVLRSTTLTIIFVFTTPPPQKKKKKIQND
jgi:hypothetical protein